MNVVTWNEELKSGKEVQLPKTRLVAPLIHDVFEGQIPSASNHSRNERNRLKRRSGDTNTSVLMLLSM